MITSAHRGRGHSLLHHAADGYSRMACSDIPAGEKKETAVGFWIRANDFFAYASTPLQ